MSRGWGRLLKRYGVEHRRAMLSNDSLWGWRFALRAQGKTFVKGTFVLTRAWDPPDCGGDSRGAGVATYIPNIKKNNRTTRVRHYVTGGRMYHLPTRSHSIGDTKDTDLRYPLKSGLLTFICLISRAYKKVEILTLHFV